MRITLRPIGGVEPGIPDELSQRLGEVFGCQVEVGEKFDRIDHAYDPKRRQYHSEILVDTIRGGRSEGEDTGDRGCRPICARFKLRLWHGRPRFESGDRLSLSLEAGLLWSSS